jgi:hypothetical protein
VPPGTGIVHQVNIEYLARTVMVRDGTNITSSSSSSLLDHLDEHSFWCRFPHRVSSADPLTCDDAGCLTSCHQAFVSLSCP